MNIRNFEADYRRMAGIKYKGTIRDLFRIILQHNIRYMWWYRKYEQRPSLFHKYKLHILAKNMAWRFVQSNVGKVYILGILII